MRPSVGPDAIIVLYWMADDARIWALTVMLSTYTLAGLLCGGGELWGDGEDVEEGVAEECRLFLRNVDTLNLLGTGVRLETDISPPSLGA